MGSQKLFLAVCLLAVTITVAVHASAPKKADDHVFLCYWGTWSIYRPEPYTFNTPQIDPQMCTHILYSFAGLNNVTNRIGSLDPWCDFAAGECETLESGEEQCGGRDTLRATVALKTQNQDLKVLLAIGGWNQASERFSVMARDPEKRAIFTESALDWIQRFDLDGIDMDWEYPASREGSIPEDKENFVLLLAEMRAAFDTLGEELGRHLYLTSAVAAGTQTIDAAYDIPEISKSLDFINVMAYDFKLWIENSTDAELIGHHSPLYPKEDESAGDRALTTSAAIQYWIDGGAPPEKLVLGVGAYGHTYTLTAPDQFNFYDRAAGPGPAQPVSQSPGTIFYFEICETQAQYNTYFDFDYFVPYATDGNMWYGHDYPYSIIAKVDYAEELGLGGMMIWSIDSDDFNNACRSWATKGLGTVVQQRMDQHRVNRNKGAQ